MTTAPYPHHHSRKFYVFLIIIVVGLVLVLMLLNEKEKGFTGLVLGEEKKSSEEEKQEVEEEKEIKNLNFNLDFDEIPEVGEGTKIEKVELSFRYPETTLKINEEVLELSNLEKVEMSVEEFEGEIYFDETFFSLKGKGEKILINNIEISAEEEIEVTFEGIVYDQLKLKNVAFKILTLKEGQGKLQLGEKLTYFLENEKIEIENFGGDIIIKRDEEKKIALEGSTKKISVKGSFDLLLE